MRSKLKVFLAFSLILTLAFELSCSRFLAWAEGGAPKLTREAQRAVYEAQQLMKKKDYLRAEQCLREFIEKNRERTHYLVEFTLANALGMAGKGKEALSHYRAAANLYPGFAATWQNMGKVYFDLKEYSKAGDCFIKAYERNKEKDPSLLYHGAVSYIMAKAEREALPHLEYLVSGKAGPPKTEWLEALLKVCMELQLKGKALGLIRRLIHKDGSEPRWWKILAQFHVQHGDYKKAVTALIIYSYLTEVDFKDLILLGDLNSVLGLPLKAAEYYDKALSMDNSPGIYEKLASAYIRGHRTRKALEVLKRALEGNPTARLYFMMGQVLYEEEKYEEAYNAFKKCSFLNAKDGKPHLMMAYCALKMGKKKIAEKALRKASRFPSQRNTANELLKHVAMKGRD